MQKLPDLKARFLYTKVMVKGLNGRNMHNSRIILQVQDSMFVQINSIKLHTAY